MFTRPWDILQANLSRMCQLSNTCKAWCVTVTSAVLLFAVKEQEQDILAIVLMPVVLFWALDAFYLSVERQFKQSANALAEKVRSDTVSMDDVFLIRTSKGVRRTGLWIKALLWSCSTIPFYGGIAGLAIWARWFYLAS